MIRDLRSEDFDDALGSTAYLPAIRCRSVTILMLSMQCCAVMARSYPEVLKQDIRPEW